MTVLEIVIFGLVPTIAWGIGIVFAIPPEDINNY
jgi:hypothetical protein